MRHDLDRLAELRRLMILDSRAERDFDHVAALLASTLRVPVAMVNLLDADRDWFKSCVGLAQTESPAALSFCEVFFDTSDDLVVVQDTSTHPRFKTHPMVENAPNVRFYAAARLRVNGQTVGTLCVYDFQPRDISSADIRQLQSLAASVVDLLQQRTRPSA